MKNFFFQKENSGFTLLEVLTSVFVLVITSLTIFSLLSASIFSLSSLKDRFVAFYLAQEGIEIVKNIRDSNFLQGASWLSGIGTGDKRGDYSSTSLSPYSDTYLKQNLSGFFQYSSGSDTKFKRKINVTQIDANRVRVTVEVSWMEKGRPQSFTLVEEITNWY
jgi:Tfp pilus assembly protein PilV